MKVASWMENNRRHVHGWKGPLVQTRVMSHGFLDFLLSDFAIVIWSHTEAPVVSEYKL